jgi:hypothetical protein
MATTVGKLRIILTANAGRFQKKMKKARKTVATFSKSATRFALKIGGIGTAIAGLVAGGGLTMLVRDAFKTSDALAKTADKLGLTTQALSGLQLAAELSGVDIRKMQMGLQRMTRRVSEAAKGTGEAKDAIKELGLDAKKLNTLSPDKMFVEIAKAMGQIANQGDRVRLAFKLFDSEGVDLVNTLLLMGVKWDDIQEITRKFGIAISRLDAAKIESVVNSFVLLRGLLKGAARQIAVNLTIPLALVTEELLDIGHDSWEMSRTIAKAFNKAGKTLLSVISTIHTVWSTALVGMELELRKRLLRMTTAWTLVANMVPGGKKLFDAIGLSEFLADNARAIQHLGKVLEGLEQGVSDKYIDLINEIGDFAFEFNRRLAGLATARTSTIQGRRAREGLIGPTGVLGVQKFGQRSLSQIATNTKNTEIGIKPLIRAMGAHGFPIYMS